MLCLGRVRRVLGKVDGRLLQERPPGGRSRTAFSLPLS